jgi:cysteinyl-tRNA synthetase
VAQSEAYSGQSPFVRYWVHNALLRLQEGDEKMTRHLGNFVSVEAALEKHSTDAIRLFLLSSHYRSPLTWKEENVLAAERGAERLRVAMRDYTGERPESPGDALSQEAERARQEFIVAMDDDFNTPRAVAQAFDLARLINQARDSGVNSASRAYAQTILKELTDVLGMPLKGRTGPTGVEPFLGLLVQVRKELREAKQWALSDRIRDQLAELGVVLEDGPNGTTWKYVEP